MKEALQNKIHVVVLLLGCFVLLPGCLQPEQRPSRYETTTSRSTFHEYCFDVREERVQFVETTSTPEKFLTEHPETRAAINGVYYAADDGRPLGRAYLDGIEYATGRGSIRGYFIMQSAEGGFAVSETKPERFEEYYMVIGTHPILIREGSVHSQAREDRYNILTDSDNAPVGAHTAPRSGIGNKSESQLCFVQSDEYLTMEDWALELQRHGYHNAINLDGGSPSQLAVRDQSLPGSWSEDTRFIIYTTK